MFQHWTSKLAIHEESCKKKQQKKEKHDALLRLHEKRKLARQFACDTMLLMCLADKENPIATITDDVLKLVFKYLCTVEN